jgi:hypothetical protein
MGEKKAGDERKGDLAGSLALAGQAFKNGGPWTNLLLVLKR